MLIVKTEWRSVLKEADQCWRVCWGLWLPLVYGYGRGFPPNVPSFLGGVQINTIAELIFMEGFHVEEMVLWTLHTVPN